MLTRAWNFRYALLKLRHAVSEATSVPHQSSMTQFIQSTLEAYQRQLTQVITLAGVSMAPTLNHAGTSSPNAVEHLLVRDIPRPSTSTVFVGDVVALHNPMAAHLDHATTSQPLDVVVRRVAAMEGDELVTDDPEDESVTLQQGMCWVLADNEDLEPPAVIDSRTFGPLKLSRIIGRVMYAAQSATNHGPVENSGDAMRADAAVLEAELDMERLCPGEL